MPCRKRKNTTLKTSLAFTESPLEFHRHPASPIFCVDNPKTANIGTANTGVSWVSPQFPLTLCNRRKCQQTSCHYSHHGKTCCYLDHQNGIQLDDENFTTNKYPVLDFVQHSRGQRGKSRRKPLIIDNGKNPKVSLETILDKPNIETEILTHCQEESVRSVPLGHSTGSDFRFRSKTKFNSSSHILLSSTESLNHSSSDECNWQLHDLQLCLFPSSPFRSSVKNLNISLSPSLFAPSTYFASVRNELVTCQKPCVSSTKMEATFSPKKFKLSTPELCRRSLRLKQKYKEAVKCLSSETPIRNTHATVLVGDTPENQYHLSTRERQINMFTQKNTFSDCF